MTWWWALVGCGSDDVVLDATETGSMTADCEGADAFSVDATATAPSGRIVGFVAVDPAVPDVGDNAWSLSVADGSGPLAGEAPRVIPWMPLHGHGLVPAEYVGADVGGGEYDVPTFDLIMPGLWEFRVDLAADGEPEDAVVFSFCAEG